MTHKSEANNTDTVFPAPGAGSMVVDGRSDYFDRQHNMRAVAELAAGIARGDHLPTTKKPERGFLSSKVARVVGFGGRIATRTAKVN